MKASDPVRVREMRVFSLATGAEIEDQSKLRTVEDPWLYYLCKIKERG